MDERRIPETNVALGDILNREPLGGFGEYVQKTREVARAQDTAVFLGRPVEETYANPDQAISDANQAVGNPLATAVHHAVAMPDKEAAAAYLTDQAEKQNDAQAYRDFVLEGAMTVGAPEYNPKLHRLLTNQSILVQMLEERANNEARSTGGKVWDFIDRYIFRYIPFGLYEDLTKSTERTGAAVAGAALSMPPAEFEEWATEYVDKVASEGFFTDENYFAFSEALGEAVNSGYDPMAGINQLLGVAEVIPLLRGVTKAGSLLSRTASVAGADAAADAVRAAERAGLAAEEGILRETMTGVLDPLTSSSPRPNMSTVAALSQENSIIADIEFLTQSGTFGRVATPEEIGAEQIRISNAMSEISSNPIVKEETVDLGLGNYGAIFTIGQVKGGAPFKLERNAQKVAANLRSKGLVARVEAEPTGGFYIKVEERLDLTTAAPAIAVDEAFGVFRSGLARAFGSSAQLDDISLNTLANQSESGFGAIHEIMQPYLRNINRLPFESKEAIGQIFKDLRDGRDSFLRTYYTEDEFKTLFRQYHPKGKAPSQADIDAYFQLQTISDAAYILDANRMAHRFVRMGYKTIDTGVEQVPAKVVQNVGRDVTVFDVSTGQYRLRSTFHEEVPIWKTSRELEGGIEHIANPSNVRSIKYEDVMGYNAGGRRTNPEANYFVTLGDTGRAIMTTFSEKQARIASEQIGNIFSEIKAVGKKLDNLVDELDQVIIRNNDWNPSIENTQDFVKLAKSKGWKPADVSFKKRNDIVESSEDLYAGITYDDLIKMKHHRADDVLMDFGGKETFNYNPVKTIVDQLSSSSAQYSYQNYTYRAKAAWVKQALKTNEIPKGMSVSRLFNETTPKGVNARKLETLRSVIRRREMYKGKAVQALEDYGQELAEFVFDKTGIKTKLGDPSNVLLKLGFQSAFGFMNIFQFFLQASHAFTIMALSPKAGAQAAAMALPLRLVMASGTEEAVRRFAKTFGMKFEDADELVKYIHTSGRNIVESDAIEKGTGPGFGISGFEGKSYLPSVVRKGLYQTSRVGSLAAHVGTTPFREGERLSRLTSMTTAFLEWKRTAKGASALSDDARNFITRREQDLTFNMTTGSRAAWQDGLLRVPTQWLSYSFRAMESVVLGRQFTKTERARLAVFFALQGGMSGMWLGQMADYVSKELGVSPDSNTYVALKYGIFDGILSELLSGMSDQEIRTAIGTRMAPLTAFTELYRKVTEESTMSALAGPSGEIVFGGTSELVKAAGLLFTGHGYASADAVERFIRTPSGVDNIYKAMGMINEGIYESKTGRKISGMEFSDVEGIMQGMGITNFKVADYYARNTAAYRKSTQVRSFSKEILRDYLSALEMYDEGNKQDALAYMADIDARIRLSGFSPYDQMSIRRQLKQKAVTDTTLMIINAIRRENEYAATVIQETYGRE